MAGNQYCMMIHLFLYFIALSNLTIVANAVVILLFPHISALARVGQVLYKKNRQPFKGLPVLPDQRSICFDSGLINSSLVNISTSLISSFNNIIHYMKNTIRCFYIWFNDLSTSYKDYSAICRCANRDIFLFTSVNETVFSKL